MSNEYLSLGIIPAVNVGETEGQGSLTSGISGHSLEIGHHHSQIDKKKFYPPNGVMTMQSQNRIFDDLVKMVNGAAGTIAGMGREAEASTRERAKEWIGGLDFVPREEFEAVKAMAAAARDDAEALRKRLDALEASLSAAAKPKPAAKKPAAPKS
jgi:BMFP domain-containing protein YqiC